MKKPDHIYSAVKYPIQPFSFNQEVALAFDDMVTRSVPLYHESQRMIVELLGKNLQKRELVYDLGCSTGTTLLNINQHLGHLNLELMGIEASPEMIKLAQEKCSAHAQNTHFIHLNLETFKPHDCAAAISHYTLQFIPKDQRLNIVKNFHDKLRPNGMFILSEKVLSDSNELNPLLINCYHDYKKSQGYTELEINQKAEALKGVLEPYTIEENLNLLRAAGFNRVDVILKWYNFATMIAFKD